MDIALLSAYLPIDRRHALAAGRSLPDRAAGAVLLADIAGFTPLSDALFAILGPRRGAEELTRLLNEVYDALIAQVHGYGGSVVVFVGDGLVCWFGSDEGLRAVACGLAMQQAIRTSGTVSFSMKVGVAAGPVRRFVVGDPQVQLLDLLAGATLDRMAQAEKAARPREVVVEPGTAARLGDRLRVAEWRAGFGVVEGLAAEVPPAPWPDLLTQALTVEQVRPYLLPPVYERLMAGQGEFLAELRPAVMLFLGFGGLDYDRDDAGPRLDAFVRWVQGVLARYDGYLLQLTSGDKGSFLYAAFGALAAHEDDAARAVAAARELQQPPADLDFITVQIGLSQGRVRVGAYGSRTRRAYGAIGNEVNLACRLMEAAPAGEIRCSQRVYQAASGWWDFEALRPVTVKGKVKPLPVYRPLSQARGRAVRVAGDLIGRQAELETIARLLAEAQLGRRRVLLLEGEAGIGKSRLVGELARLAREWFDLAHHRQGVAWLMGAGQSIEQGTPYRAWRDLLAAYFGLDDRLDPGERQRRVQDRVAEAAGPALAGRVPLLNDILRLDLPESDLTRSFDPKLRHESLTALVVDLLRAAARAGPLALVLEDAHWLDSLSWELTLAVARALFDQPVLLLVALRPLEESARPEYTALADLEGAETLRLGAMPPAETVALAAARLGLSPAALPTEVAGLVRERAGGNPFFAEELAYALRDSGALAVEDGVCTLRADLEALRDSVPDTVEGVVLSRIDRLSPEKQLTLKVAAVIGRSFLYHTLRDVHPQQVVEDLLRAHLDDLARRDLTPLEALEPELSYLFKHVITQQVAYDTLLFAQRRELHRAVAGWYERVYAANLSPYYPLLVHHWHQAEDTVQERHYAKLAGEQAAAQYANAEAVTYLSRALDLTPETDYAERYTLLLAREKVRSLQGAREDQAQDLADLERLTVALDDNRKRAEVALRQAAHALVTADYPAAITTAQVAIALAQAAQDVNSQAAGYRQWGKALWYQGDYKAARDHLEQALQRYRETGDRWGESASLVILGVFSWSEGDYVGARGSHERALHLFREIGDRQGEAMSLTNLGLVSWNQGKYAEAEAYYEQVLRTCHEMGDLYNLGLALNNLGVITADQGGYASAQAYYEQALHICRVTGDRHTESLTLSNLGCICDYLGDYASARSFHEQSLHICRDIGDRRGEGIALAISGLLFHHLDDDKTAHNYCQHALLVLRELGNRRLQGQAQTYLGHALASLGYLTEAATAYQQALELLREIGEHNLATEPLAGLARVSMAQGDLPQAQAQIEEILKHLESNTLAGTEEPFLVYLTCCRVLQAGRDPRAEEVLVTAYRLLQERAARITDEKLRHSFLENVAAHRELIAAYQARQAAGETG